LIIETQRSCKAEADRLEAGGFNPLMESKKSELPAQFQQTESDSLTLKFTL
jgi:hypothetical protein